LKGFIALKRGAYLMRKLIDNFIEINFKSADGFRIVRETIRRMGTILVNDTQTILYPQCFLFHKKEHYYIIHRKELILINNYDPSYKSVNIRMEDILVRNKIAKMLSNFDLINILKMDKFWDYDGIKFNLDTDYFLNLNIIKNKDMDKFVVDDEYDRLFIMSGR
jgi:hypothetical protein